MLQWTNRQLATLSSSASRSRCKNISTAFSPRSVATHFAVSYRRVKTSFQSWSRFGLSWEPSDCQLGGEVKENNDLSGRGRKIKEKSRKNWKKKFRSKDTTTVRMNVINSVVLTASSISSMVPLIGLVIFVGGILVLLVKWVAVPPRISRPVRQPITDRHISMAIRGNGARTLEQRDKKYWRSAVKHEKEKKNCWK